MPPIQAKNGIYTAEIPIMIAKIVISPEPDDMPKRNGPARLFLNRLWSKAPDRPRAEPVSKDAKSLGNLKFQIINVFISLPEP